MCNTMFFSIEMDLDHLLDMPLLRDATQVLWITRVEGKGLRTFKVTDKTTLGIWG